MKLPKLPRPASVLEARYTAAQMKEYAKRVQLMERHGCLGVLWDYSARPDLSNDDESLLKHLWQLIDARGQE